ncbi:hypothetical protein BC938DRAFT_482686, partial [Jimgerdemannia flammicorona]
YNTAHIHSTIISDRRLLFSFSNRSLALAPPYTLILTLAYLTTLHALSVVNAYIIALFKTLLTHPYSFISPEAPLKRGREQELELPRKAPKILGAASISGTKIFETTAVVDHPKPSNQQLQLPYGIPSFYSFRTREGMIFADKTIYIEHLERYQEDFRYTFLRPRRFGKSAFLNMLCAYYDIHTADHFNDLFGPLYIGKHPTPWHNQHLVLKFDLSSISVSGPIAETKASFLDEINDTLKRFVVKYKNELGNPQIDQVINAHNAAASLKNTFDLAGSRHHTLFVGVDEYDAPVNNSVFTGDTTGMPDAIKKVSQIEQYFKESFFAPLKEGCGDLGGRNAIISKYFLTGVTPAFRAGISPLAEAIIVSDERELHGICGFTENEVKTIVQHYLRKDEQGADGIIHTMRKLYNGYYFASSDYDESDPQPPLLYNPHLVFHYVRKYDSNGIVAKPQESIAVHSTHVLKSISDIGEFSVDDLLELMMSGSVESKINTEFGFADLLSIGKDRSITLSLLIYLGVLTRGPKGNLRIPNEVMKTEVLERIHNYLRDQDAIRPLLGPAFDSLVRGNINDFVKLLEAFFKTRALRSFFSANEAMLQSIVELILDKPSYRVPELRLVIDGNKGKGEGRYGFADVFIPATTTISGGRTFAELLELKYLTLGLFKGAANNWSHHPTYSDMEDLEKRLSGEDEDKILERNYMHWSKDLGRPETKTVSSILEGRVKQLRMYMETVAKGQTKRWNDSGVLDSRIKVGEGSDYLQGHVVMGIGKSRFIARSTQLTQTSKAYNRIVQF